MYDMHSSKIDVSINRKASWSPPRYEWYMRTFQNFFGDKSYSINELSYAISDVRWAEVPSSLAASVMWAAQQDLHRDSISKELSEASQWGAFLHFNTTDRLCIPVSFFKARDVMMGHVVTAIVHDSCDNNLAMPGPARLIFRRAVDLCVDLFHGMRDYFPLDTLSKSNGLHAILSVCEHRTDGILYNGRKILGESFGVAHTAACKCPVTYSHVLFMNRLAEHLLREEDRDVHDSNTPFCHYARSVLWREFSVRCVSFAVCNAHAEIAHAIQELENIVDAAFEAVANTVTPERPIQLAQRSVGARVPPKWPALALTRNESGDTKLLQRWALTLKDEKLLSIAPIMFLEAGTDKKRKASTEDHSSKAARKKL